MHYITFISIYSNYYSILLVLYEIYNKIINENENVNEKRNKIFLHNENEIVSIFRAWDL